MNWIKSMFDDHPQFCYAACAVLAFFIFFLMLAGGRPVSEKDHEYPMAVIKCSQQVK